MTIKIRQWGRVGIVLFGWVAVWLCAAAAHAGDTEPAADLGRWGRLLVMPFYDMAAIHGKDASIRGPLSRQVYVTGEVLSEADLVLNRILQRQLAKKPGLAWESGPPANIRVPLNPSTTRQAHIESIAEKARHRAADHVLSGYLYAYRQRDGGNYGAKTTAKVIFELVMVQTQTGRVVRHRRFDETQQPLSDNLLNLGKFIRRKGRWISAQEMAEQAMQDMLNEILNAGPPPNS